MRHNKKFNHLGRTSAHRKAMLANMASSLILHKRIKTTVAKAKALRMYVEPLITKTKGLETQEQSMHAHRVVFAQLKDKHAVKELFGEVAAKVADRPGGYTRIIKLPNRLGDNAAMCFIELVDYNELMLNADKAKKKVRRSRRGGAKKAAATVETVKKAAEQAKEKVEETAAKVEKEVKADNLTKIEGIGPKIAETLTNAGIASFADLAKADVAKITEIIADVKGHHVPDTWPKQAQMAADGKWDELKAWQDELNGGVE